VKGWSSTQTPRGGCESISVMNGEVDSSILSGSTTNLLDGSTFLPLGATIRWINISRETCLMADESRLYTKVVRHNDFYLRPLHVSEKTV
jgi:hypothetical protein